jgi:hypothetical protein
MPAELDGERKADITQAYDGDGFTGCGHEGSARGVAGLWDR